MLLGHSKTNNKKNNAQREIDNLDERSRHHYTSIFEIVKITKYLAIVILSSLRRGLVGYMFILSRYSAITQTALLALPCRHPSGQRAMTIAVFDAWSVKVP